MAFRLENFSDCHALTNCTVNDFNILLLLLLLLLSFNFYYFRMVGFIQLRMPTRTVVMAMKRRKRAPFAYGRGKRYSRYYWTPCPGTLAARHWQICLVVDMEWKKEAMSNDDR